MQDGILRDVNEINDQKGILSGVDEIIDKILGVTSIGKVPPHYRNKEACDQLHRSPPQNFDARLLLTNIYDKIESNWRERLRKEPPSKENWRFEPKLKIDPGNKSLEVQLERAIVNISQSIWPDAKNWANQVPTASGLWDHNCDKRRAIDLVHVRPGRNGYETLEFIELKVTSDHPVYAAMEVLLYGMLYMLSRRHLKELEYNVAKQPLLQAKEIHLVVLAPAKYYEGYQFDWLEKEITTGLKEFGELEGYTMDFQFQAFPWDCLFEKSTPDEPLVIIKALNDRKGVEDIRRQYRDEAKRLDYKVDSMLAEPRSWVEKSKKRRAETHRPRRNRWDRSQQ